MEEIQMIASKSLYHSTICTIARIIKMVKLHLFLERLIKNGT